MCLLDVIVAVWAVGGSSAILLGYKSFTEYKKTKKKTDANPGTDHSDHPVSAE